MKANADLVEILPGLAAAERIGYAHERVELVVLPVALFGKDVAHSEGPRLRRVPGPGHRMAEELWETLCFAALGLCALLSIGLCFL